MVMAAITLVTVDTRSGGTGALSGARSALHDALAPVQEATHRTLAPVGDFLSGAADQGALRTENQRLRQLVASLQAQGAAAVAAQAQAEAVIANAHLPFVGRIPTVTARVIDGGLSNFQIAVTINRGSADGLVVGQPVVAAGSAGGAGGLVGSVQSALRHTATVELITDPSFVVGVRLDAANTGIAEGVGTGQPLRVSVVRTNAPSPALTVGQPISTSGLQFERYPPGMPVGRVTSVSPAGTTVDLRATLRPFVDLAALDFVEVELWSPQTPVGP